jgi:hypothetical protein
VMSYIILGAGSVGFPLAKQLVDEGKDVVLIEKDSETARHVNDPLDCLVIDEVGNNLDKLRRAGITKAEYFIGVTNSDEVNMIACGMASGGNDLITSLSSALVTVGNIGPGFGRIGPTLNYAFYPDYIKWFLSFAMMVGRLEVYTVLVLLTPRFWRG